MTNRAILIIPQIANADAIQNIRLSFDPLAKKVPPHVTLVFPFKSTIHTDALARHVQAVAASIPPFQISFGSAEAHNDGYVWLPVIQGQEAIIHLHDHLYTGILSQFLSQRHVYQPHLTLAHVAEANVQAAVNAATRLTNTHTAWIDQIIIEEILIDGSTQVENSVPLNNKTRPY
ncbi:MAG: 2'-5' RNA ligase family protein [Chloroflexi bacterium]|nr:2'-5' RNA ligase family protein [Chloroflexota bacterium]